MSKVEHDTSSGGGDRLRRGGAALLGVVLCAAGVVFAGLILYLSFQVAVDESSCSADFWCPGAGERALVAAGLAVPGLGASVLAVLGGSGFLRYASATPVALGRSVLLAVLAPAVAFGWLVALVLYAAELGSFR